MPPTPARIDATLQARASVRKRVAVLGVAMLGWAGCMGYRLVDLQINRCDEMRTQARRQQEQVLTLDAHRGLLQDRNNRELAMSIEVDSLYAIPAEIEDPGATARALARVLAGTSGPPFSVTALTEKLTGDKLFVWVRRKVDPSVRTAVEALNLKGVAFARENKRFYPNGSLAAHILGWVGMDNKGMEGLEMALDGRVRGRDGQVFALRDARGRRFLKVTVQEAVPGNDVALTIDETIQHIAERELRFAMEETGAGQGTVIVMEPATGDILALANEPTYNPNRPADSPPEHRKNRSIVDAYEPGSTFKVVTIAAALEKNLVNPMEMFDCQNGSLRVGRATIRDHKPFGLLTVTEVLERSSNVGAMKIGLRLKQDDFYDTIRRFGFGSKTGIELPAEAYGLVREPKDWSGVSQATLSFGQELSVTPLQLITAFSAVANGGMLQAPRILLRETDDAGTIFTKAAARPAKRVIREETARALTQMMLRVVDEGTAKAARMPGYSVAGKTGTAQKIGPEGTYAAGRFIASFAGFVPSTRPALAILIMLDEPRGSLYHGGDIAAPVFRRIALPALRYLGVPPEDGRFLVEGDEPTLVADAHARRWTEPIPLDEKELKAEQAKREREELKARQLKERQLKERGRRGDEEEREVEVPVVPARRPLPAPSEVIAGDSVTLADLRGHSLRRVVAYLGSVGLRARLVAADDAPGGDGLIVAQMPEPGVLVGKGMEVTLTAGRYLPKTEVERVVGEDRETGDGMSRERAAGPARRSMRL